MSVQSYATLQKVFGRFCAAIHDRASNSVAEKQVSRGLMRKKRGLAAYEVFPSNETRCLFPKAAPRT